MSVSEPLEPLEKSRTPYFTFWYSLEWFWRPNMPGQLFHEKIIKFPIVQYEGAWHGEAQNYSPSVPQVMNTVTPSLESNSLIFPGPQAPGSLTISCWRASPPISTSLRTRPVARPRQLQISRRTQRPSSTRASLWCARSASRMRKSSSRRPGSRRPGRNWRELLRHLVNIRPSDLVWRKRFSV